MMLSDITVVGLMVAATHFGAEIPEGKPRNAFTPGVYVVHKSGATFGAYHNSFKRNSIQAGYTHDLGQGWAISGGIVNGYPKNGQDRILPYVAVSYAFGAKSGARLITMPEKTIPLAGAWEFRR